MNPTEIFLSLACVIFAIAWGAAMHAAKENARKLAECLDELANLMKAIRQTDDLARKSKFVHLYP